MSELFLVGKVCGYTSWFIGVGRFRILGGGGEGGQGQCLEYWVGQGGGANSQQAHGVVMTSM